MLEKIPFNGRNEETNLVTEYLQFKKIIIQ